MTSMAVTRIAEIEIAPDTARIYEHGWQSWSPSGTYPALDRGPHPVGERRHVLCYRPESVSDGPGFRGEGLLAVDPGDGGAVQVFAAVSPVEQVPSIRATLSGPTTLAVDVDGDVEWRRDGEDIVGALAAWADDIVARHSLPAPRPAPTVWCSWYHYFTQVTEDDIWENVEMAERLDLPIDVIQIDDGYQAALGDWLSLSGRFASLEALAGRIREAGRRVGIWVAPFLVDPASRLAADHPEWLVRGVDGAPAFAGHNWGTDLYALDTTHPAALAYLHDVFSTMAGWGIDYFKIDFIYAGAIPGGRYGSESPLAAYRRGVEMIRTSIGDGYLLGCGAPILPSIGLFDAMRVSPDTGPEYLPSDGDFSQPSILAATVTGEARAFQHGRFWVNDPDCLIVRPEVERRVEWAAHVERCGGLMASSDRLASLDAWGLERTRSLLGRTPPARFVS